MSDDFCGTLYDMLQGREIPATIEGGGAGEEYVQVTLDGSLKEPRAILRAKTEGDEVYLSVYAPDGDEPVFALCRLLDGLGAYSTADTMEMLYDAWAVAARRGWVAA